MNAYLRAAARFPKVKQQAKKRLGKRKPDKPDKPHKIGIQLTEYF